MRHIRKYEGAQSPLMRSPDFARRKKDLVDYMGSLGFDLLDDEEGADLDGDGQEESLLMRFDKGDVKVIALLGNYTFPDPDKGRPGTFQYRFQVSLSRSVGGEVLLRAADPESAANDMQGVRRLLPKYLEQGRLKNLGVKDARPSAPDPGEPEEERMISRKEYDDMLNAAIDDEDWEEASRIQGRWGGKFYKENVGFESGQEGHEIGQETLDPLADKEYEPTKREYDEMLDAALDAKDWERATEIQRKWGARFYRESMRHIRAYALFRS